jgi:hypothetical protein
MTKQEQINFVRELCNAGMIELIKNIDQNKIPENWDGIELRWLVADKFNSCQTIANTSSSKKRKKDYNNTVIVNNL